MNISKILLEYQPAQPSPSPRQVPCLTCFQEQVCWEPDYFTLRYTRCPIEYLHNHESCYQEGVPGETWGEPTSATPAPRTTAGSYYQDKVARLGGLLKRSHAVVCIFVGLLQRVRSELHTTYMPSLNITLPILFAYNLSPYLCSFLVSIRSEFVDNLSQLLPTPHTP